MGLADMESMVGEEGIVVEQDAEPRFSVSTTIFLWDDGKTIDEFVPFVGIVVPEVAGCFFLAVYVAMDVDALGHFIDVGEWHSGGYLYVGGVDI